MYNVVVFSCIIQLYVSISNVGRRVQTVQPKNGCRRVENNNMAAIAEQKSGICRAEKRYTVQYHNLPRTWLTNQITAFLIEV